MQATPPCSRSMIGCAGGRSATRPKAPATFAAGSPSPVRLIARRTRARLISVRICGAIDGLHSDRDVSAVTKREAPRGGYAARPLSVAQFGELRVSRLVRGADCAVQYLWPSGAMNVQGCDMHRAPRLKSLPQPLPQPPPPTADNWLGVGARGTPSQAELSVLKDQAHSFPSGVTTHEDTNCSPCNAQLDLDFRRGRAAVYIG